MFISTSNLHLNDVVSNLLRDNTRENRQGQMSNEMDNGVMYGSKLQPRTLCLEIGMCVCYHVVRENVMLTRGLPSFTTSL